MKTPAELKAQVAKLQVGWSEQELATLQAQVHAENLAQAVLSILDGRRGRVVRAKGRPVTFSKQTDAADLFRALQLLGVGYRQAEEAVEALLGVDGRELRRGLKSPIQPLGEDHMVVGAVLAILQHRDLIRSRLTSPDVYAKEVLAAVPEPAQAWLQLQLKVVHSCQEFSPGIEKIE